MKQSIMYLPWEPTVPSFLGGYNPYIGGLKPSFFMFWGPRVVYDTVDGRNLAPADMVNIPFHYLQGFICPRWCRISSINSIHVPTHCELMV